MRQVRSDMDQSEFPVTAVPHITYPVLGYGDEMPWEDTPDGAQIIKVRCAPTGAAGAICAPCARLYVCKHEPTGSGMFANMRLSPGAGTPRRPAATRSP